MEVERDKDKMGRWGSDGRERTVESCAGEV